MSKEYICKICNRSFESNRSLSRHLLRAHAISREEYNVNFLKNDKIIKKNYKCEICNTFYKKIRDLIKHIEYKNDSFHWDFYHNNLTKIFIKNNWFKCLICNKYANDFNGLINHIILKHNIKYKDYYDKYLKKENEGICPVCGKTTTFLSGKYNKHCSQKCNVNDKKLLEQRNNRIKQTNLKKYGVECVFENENIKEKISNTNLKRYGTKTPLQNENIKEKIRQTNLLKRGVEYPSQSKEVLDKRKVTYIKNWGVDSPCKNLEVHRKKIKSLFSYKVYILPSNKKIDLMGYEPQFLDYVFEHDLLKENEIIYNPEKIEYFDENNKQHYYFPDFYIPKYNLIVEIKNSYLYKKYNDKILLKEKYTRLNGFNYIIIIDNDFQEFEKLINKRKNII